MHQVFGIQTVVRCRDRWRWQPTLVWFCVSPSVVAHRRGAAFASGICALSMCFPRSADCRRDDFARDSHNYLRGPSLAQGAHKLQRRRGVSLNRCSARVFDVDAQTQANVIAKLDFRLVQLFTLRIDLGPPCRRQGPVPSGFHFGPGSRPKHRSRGRSDGSRGLRFPMDIRTAAETGRRSTRSNNLTRRMQPLRASHITTAKRQTSRPSSRQSP